MHRGRGIEKAFLGGEVACEQINKGETSRGWRGGGYKQRSRWRKDTIADGIVERESLQRNKNTQTTDKGSSNNNNKRGVRWVTLKNGRRRRRRHRTNEASKERNRQTSRTDASRNCPSKTRHPRTGKKKKKNKVKDVHATTAFRKLLLLDLTRGLGAISLMTLCQPVTSGIGISAACCCC